MDYEKKYKEALERAKYYQKENGSAVISAIFPELAESEDEKIRKELLAVINDLVLPDEQQSRFVAWLEKKPADKVEPFKVGDWVMNKSGDTFSNGSISAHIQRIEGHRVWFEHGTYAEEWELKKIL